MKTIDNNKEVQVIKVIRTTLERRGNGKDDPIRRIEQYWDMEGNLIIENDPCKSINSKEIK